MMDLVKSYYVALKDMKEVFSSISIYGPMIGVPLFFAIILPVLTNYVSLYTGPALASRIENIAALPPGVNVKSVLFMSFFSINVLGPVFLTMPIVTASVIAADSFAGEKERKTSEALLSTPISVNELLFGKIIASFIPTLLLTLLVFGVYGYITNALAFSTFGVYILPTLPWIMMIVASPFLAIATISVVILVSSHVKGVKEAQQISTLLVLPILVMPFASILNVASFTVTFFAWVIVFLALLDFLIIYISVRSFNKESILGT
ncbi:MAG: ABC transporter permease [Candidatus Micrarchaeota archaeon]|nr:ABC transporter permease [Candidatus Micrarchaeota archaeon]